MKSNQSRNLEIIPIRGIPDIQAGDDVGKQLIKAIQNQEELLSDDDILVITQKIVSKAENRVISSKSIVPTQEAIKLAACTNKSPQLVELILRESRQIIRHNENTIIVEHNLGFICANAGIDQSNIDHAGEEKRDEKYLLLPENPDESASKIRNILQDHFNVKIGVMIIDSHGRAWRFGTVGVAIGISGMPGLVDLRGTPDLYGRELKITRVGAADELAGAASLVMGQADECIPAVIARGFPYELRDAKLAEMLRPEEMDLFR